MDSARQQERRGRAFLTCWAPPDSVAHTPLPVPLLRTHDDVPHTDEVALLGDARDDGGGGHGDLTPAEGRGKGLV